MQWNRLGAVTVPPRYALDQDVSDLCWLALSNGETRLGYCNYMDAMAPHLADRERLEKIHSWTVHKKSPGSIHEDLRCIGDGKVVVLAWALVDVPVFKVIDYAKLLGGWDEGGKLRFPTPRDKDLWEKYAGREFRS